MCLGIDRDDGGQRGAWVEGTPGGAPLYSGPLPLGDGAVFGGVRGVRGCQVCRSGSRPASPLLSPCGKVTKRVGRETSPTCDFKTAACPEAGEERTHGGSGRCSEPVACGALGAAVPGNFGGRPEALAKG